MNQSRWIVGVAWLILPMLCSDWDEFQSLAILEILQLIPLLGLLALSTFYRSPYSLFVVAVGPGAYSFYLLSNLSKMGSVQGPFTLMYYPFSALMWVALSGAMGFALDYEIRKNIPEGKWH